MKAYGLILMNDIEMEQYLLNLKIKIRIVILACVLIAVMIVNVKYQETRVIDEYDLLKIHTDHVSYLNTDGVIEFLDIDKVSEFNLVYNAAETALKRFRSVTHIYLINPLNGKQLFYMKVNESETWKLYVVEEQLEFFE